MPAKLVFGLKNGQSVQKEIQDAEFKHLLGKKIHDKVKGDGIGYAGYEFEVSGGSDYCGFPMRWDVPGFQRKRILAIEGVGLKKEANGIKIRKTVCGNTIHPKITQVNLKVLKEGSTPLAPPKEAKAEEKKAEAAPKAEAKHEPKAEAPKHEHAPKAEEKKHEHKAEEKK
ncbi:MAG TPA: S6e family ribosomal protein [Candidatus Binatia bacterium]|nr:S6e family ribosomal protein [Candidatus Binatia bacterium]